MINGGYCGTSSYGEAFEDEFCDRLFNIRGAVAMSNTGADTNEVHFLSIRKLPKHIRMKAAGNILQVNGILSKPSLQTTRIQTF